MRSCAVLSVAFLAATVAPVMSVPIAAGQLTQPTIESVVNSLNETIPVSQEYVNTVDAFLSTLSTGQLQDLTDIVAAALNVTLPTIAPMPTATTNSTQPDPSQPVKRQFDILGLLIKGIAEAGTKIGEHAAESAIKRAVEPTPTAKAEMIATSSFAPNELDQLEKRQLGSLFGILFRGAAKAGIKYGEDAAESAIKSAIKRTPTPMAEGGWQTPPTIPTPPPIPSCLRSRSCGRDVDLD